jgi:lipoprotein-releasing system permease protein
VALYRAWARAGGSRVFLVFALAGLVSVGEAVRFALGYGIAARVGFGLAVDFVFLGAALFPAGALVLAAFGQRALHRAAATGDQALMGRGRRLLFISALVAQPGLPGYAPRVLAIVAVVGLLSYEAFVAWRYLYSPKRSVPLIIIGVTGVAALGAALFFILGRNRVDFLTVSLTIGGVILCLAALLNFFSVFSTVAISGMALGVGVLTVVLSITSGFQQAFRDKVLGVNAHVIVMKYGLDFSEYEDVMSRLAKIDGVVGLDPFYFNEMMVSKGPNRAGVLIKGIDPDRVGQVLDLPKQIREGSLAALKEPAVKGRPPGALLGAVLAKKLKVKLGDTIYLVVPFSGIEALQSGKTPPSREFRVAGIFYAGFDEYDKRLMYVNLRDAQRLAGPGQEGTVTGIELKLKDVYAAEKVARKIEDVLGGSPYRTIDWRELNHNLFTALLLQKLVLSLFVSLIVLVASFLIIATLTMMSLSKTREIAILRSMGAQRRGIFGLFAAMGMIMGGMGTALGLGLGALLANIVTRYGYKLDPKVYLINELPVRMSVWEFATTAAVTLAIAFLATLYPASRASRLHPVEGLRSD